MIEAHRANSSPRGGTEDLCFGLDAPLQDVMRTMRAIRRLRADPVDRDLLEQLVEASTWAPSASNAQAYSWVIVTDRNRMRCVAELWALCFELYRDTVARVPAPGGDPAKAARMMKATANQSDHFAEVSAVLIACYDLRWQRRALRQRAPALVRRFAALGITDGLAAIARARRAAQMAEAASIYPGVQNLLLTARALGLGANLTTFQLMLEPRFKQALAIPRGIRTFALVPVGWPEGKLGPVARQPASEAILWERWYHQGKQPTDHSDRIDLGG